MTAPTQDIIQVGYKNPDATEELGLSLAIIPNTAEDDLKNNIRVNSAEYPEWAQLQPITDKPAVLIGGGPSIQDHIDDIRKLKADGAVIFACNKAATWANILGIEVDYQVIIDAKLETSTLVDSKAKTHFFASQVHPTTLAKAKNPVLFHLAVDYIEECLPEERVKKGGYVLVGGDSTVGICAMCAAYTQGFRDFHVFGYDSSHRDGESHGYEQRINATMPTTQINWNGKDYQVSIAMKSQAERFQIYAKALQTDGCHFSVYGDGLLQDIYRAKPEDLPEKDKYQLMWMFDSYRECSPGEQVADYFYRLVKPDSKVIDFGCGTGRGSLRLHNIGVDVLLMDFTDNSRDQECINLPFIQHDLTNPSPVKSEYGFCTDVMEHIPTEDVETVVKNIMDASEKTFFQISTIDDHFGDLVGTRLHLTVKPHDWWKALFERLGYTVLHENNQLTASIFVIKTVST